MNSNLTRRQFLRRSAALGAGAALYGPIAVILEACAGSPAAAPPAPSTPAPAAAPAPPQAASAAQSPPLRPRPATRPPVSGQNTPESVRLLSWTRYELSSISTSFESTYGLPVTFTSANDSEEMFGKVKSGGPGAYDVVGADGLWCWEYFRSDLIEPLDLAQFDASDGLFSEFRTYAPWLVPDGRVLEYPSAASPQILNYNQSQVQLPDSPSLEVLFDPTYNGKVSLIDDFAQNFIHTAAMLGYEEFERDAPEGSRWFLPDDVLTRAKQELIRAKPNFKSLWKNADDLARQMASNEITLAIGNSYGALRARDQGNHGIRVAFQRERTMGWVDGHVILKNAADREPALRWVDHLHSAENVAATMKRVWLPFVNRRAIDILANAGYQSEIEVLQAHSTGEWSTRYSQFRQVEDPEKFKDAWVEFLSA